MNIVNTIKEILPSSLKHMLREKNFLGRAGRRLTVFDDDIFVVSYPKSGNTWTRFLIANLFYKGEEITFANIEGKVPDIYQSTDRALRKMARPRIIKSHEYFDPRYRRVICIVRDPRDVAVSYYHHLIKTRFFNESYPKELFVERFLDANWDTFGSWGDNLGSWIGARDGDKNFLLLRYEDMLHNTAHELKKIVDFLNLRVSDADIEQAVTLSSFDRMQNLEKTQSDNWKAVRSTRKDKPFVRSGKAEAWRTELSSEQAKRISQKWPKLMARFNYDPPND